MLIVIWNWFYRLLHEPSWGVLVVARCWGQLYWPSQVLTNHMTVLTNHTDISGHQSIIGKSLVSRHQMSSGIQLNSTEIQLRLSDGQLTADAVVLAAVSPWLSSLLQDSLDQVEYWPITWLYWPITFNGSQETGSEMNILSYTCQISPWLIWGHCSGIDQTH